MYGNDDAASPDRRRVANAGKQQHAADCAGDGDGCGGSDGGDVQRNRGGNDSDESECDSNDDDRQQFTNGNDQSAGAGACVGCCLQPREPGTGCRKHLHGNAEADGSCWRIERGAFEQQHIADGSDNGDGGSGSDGGDIQRHGGGFDSD